MNKIDFQNLPSTKTPINAENLNQMQTNIEEAVNEARKEKYSTEEQKIGTWTDGKPLYRKIVSGTFGTVTQDKESTVEINLPNVNFVLVDKYWLNRISINNAINQGTTESLIYLGYTSIYSSGSTVRFRTKQSWASKLTVYAIIIYTKTTD